LYPEGLFVQRADRRYRDVLGSRVVRIGNRPVDEAMALVSEVIHHDNEHTVKDHLPARLVMPEVLHALGLTGERDVARFEVANELGERTTLELTRVERGHAVDWVDVRTSELPLYLEPRHRNFWLERLEADGFVYVKFDVIENEDDETLADFARRFASTMADPDIGQAVIDLRGCHGGDHSLTRPLLHALIRAERLMEIGNLYVLTDRATFSAATLFALDLERHTPVLFAGEPMGGKPNSYGDSRKILLPETGLTLRVSTLYWQAHPKDDRMTLPVHFPVTPTFQDYRAGRDPVLAFVLEGARLVTGDEGAQLAGVWEGTMGLAEWSYPLKATFSQPSEGGWAIAVEGFETQNLSVERPSLSFEMPIDIGVLRFDVKLRQVGLIGRGTIDGREISLVLRRQG
ncbi:MAG: hypothetical protein O7A98_06875, partial [Acidobacteria bacterium]|nr:hypothetical protein [Acidobacteriota bacterium]